MQKSKITANIPLKIVSLIIGFLIWIIVINVDNPTETRVFTLSGESVELLNTAYIDSFDKMCMQDDDPDPIRVTVTAERKVLRRLSTSNIQVYADMQQAVSLVTNPVMVPITAIVSGVSTTNIKVTPQYLGIRLEDKVSQEFVVNVSYGDTKPAKGYEVGTQTVTPEKVKVTGPKSLVSKIDRVSAVVNVSGKSRDVTEEVNLTIVDKNQDILSEGRMAYLTLDNNAKAAVTTKFWKIQQGIRLTASYRGEPASGYHVENMAVVPDTVSIAGSEKGLSELKSRLNTIQIESEELDITGKSEDIEYKIGLQNYLPSEVKLTSGTSEDVYINIEILPDSSHSFTIPSGEIRIMNLREDLQASFESDSVRIRVKADGTNQIDDLEKSLVRASVDLGEYSAGSYEVPVQIILPEGYELLEEAFATIQILEITNLDEDSE